MFLVLGPCTYLFTVVIQPASFRECELLRAVGMNGGYTMTSKSMPLSHSIQVFIKSKSQHDFLPSLTCFIPDFVLPDSMRTGSLSRKYGYQNHIELFYMWGKMHRNIHAILIFITTTQHTHTETHTHTHSENEWGIKSNILRVEYSVSSGHMYFPFSFESEGTYLSWSP